jgi:hypothetical protein
MKERTKSVLQKVFSEFETGKRFREVERYGSGHINETYKVGTDTTSCFILQRINSEVFKDIAGLMRNIGIVTRHLENVLSGGGQKRGLVALKLVSTKNGELYYTDSDGSYWRLYNFIEGTKSYDLVESKEFAYRGGKAFGEFQYLTSGIDPQSLTETIPFFHDIEKRLETFSKVMERDPEGRVKEVMREIEFVKKRENEMMVLQQMIREGKIPMRVTHNDTKFNNILFDREDRAICIVDLDTVMPGTVLFDFGDAIRTGASTAVEDERELEKVSIDLDLYKSYSEGYLEAAGRFLLPQEKGLLAFSAKFMTYLIGLRFLTDHLDGDHYYRIHFQGHNLQRARTQFRLLETMEEKYEEMKEVIFKCEG